MVASTERRQVSGPTVGGAVHAEPWSFILLALAGGLVAGLLLKSPLFRRGLKVYRMARKIM